MAETKDRPVAEMTTDELRAECSRVEVDLARIKTQIAHAKGKAMADGAYADPVWWANVNGALRFVGHRHQVLLREIAARNRAARTSAQQSREQRFIQAARRRLQPETYAAIWQEVDDADALARAQTIHQT